MHPWDGEIRLRVRPSDTTARGGSGLRGRMFYQLWEDSVNIKQPLARQTSFQMGTCTPGPPGQVSLPGVVGPARGCCGRRICRRAGLGVATGPLQDTVQMRTHCPPLHPFLLRLAAWVGVGGE